ncbi:MAG: NAD-dependent epimerase/dehydratase family protein [Chloroflexi bacterium]|nr:NAD-dependent epimerase/dehydratase family protein [Chloroflexota bacterium]
MRITVTGAAGFVGSHLCEALLDAGHHVVALDAFVPYYPRELKERNLAELRGSERFIFHETDLRSDALEPILEASDAVIHLAAMAGLALSWRDLELYASCNLLATGRLLDAVRSTGIRRLVHVSTSSVYGTEAVGNEGLPLRPISPYGVTKLAAEHLVSAHAAAFGIDTVVLRYFSIYGPRQRPDMAYHRFIEAMLDGRTIDVYGDGEQSRSNTFVGDAVSATLLALERGRSGTVYNVGGGETITLNEAIELIAEAIGVRPEVIRGPTRPGDQRHTAADVTLAAQELDWRPVTAAREGLVRQVAWQREQRVDPGTP